MANLQAAGITVRQRTLRLVAEAKKWKAEYNRDPNPEAKEIYNRLCDTLDACNAWLQEYEGESEILNGVETGPVPVEWSVIP